MAGRQSTLLRTSAPHLLVGPLGRLLRLLSKTHNIFPGYKGCAGERAAAAETGARRVVRKRRALVPLTTANALPRAHPGQWGSSPRPCCSHDFVLGERQAAEHRARRGGGLPPGPSPRGGGRSRARQGAVRGRQGAVGWFPGVSHAHGICRFEALGTRPLNLESQCFPISLCLSSRC